MEKYGTQANFAHEIGISTNAMSNKMTCKTGLSQQDMESWAGLLDIDRVSYWDYFFT